MESKKTIQAYYDEDPKVEWERIADRPEFLLTCRYLDRYIKPGQRVLDLGGGPGRYSLYLAARGCAVTLVDLSPQNAAFALGEAQKANLPLRALAGDACTIDTQLAGETFDHVLLMGPLYHLLAETDRVRAVQGSLALLPKGGMLFASFISMFASILYAMKFEPQIVLDPTEQAFYDLFLQGKSFGGQAFTQAYFAQQKEILPFMAQFPLQKRHLLAQEGISSPCEANIMGQSPAVVAAWLDLCERLCEQEALLSWGEHLLYVGEKTSGCPVAP